MTFTGAALCAVAVVFLVLYLKPQQKEIAILLGVLGITLLFTVSLTRAGAAIQMIRAMVEESGFSAEVETMLKALGIAATAQITADICREGGEPFVASQVELVGRMEIILLALPLLSRLLILVRNMLV